MLAREKIWGIIDKYSKKDIKICVIGSHSALDVCDGAVEEGFRTIAICQKGREKTYDYYFKSHRNNDGKVVRGVVDDCWVLNKFADVMAADLQEKLRAENAIMVPNRSFTSYVPLKEIEEKFEVPLFGSRSLLRIEEREERQNYYWLLEKAGLPYPREIKHAEDIEGLVIVKLHHAVKRLERGFFTAASYEEFKEKAAQLIKQGVISSADLEKARIEEYIIGPVFNLDFFYSPLETRAASIELLGIDWRFETSLDGHVRLPAAQQLSLRGSQVLPEYTVCGHNSATLRESLLEKAFLLAEKFVKATQEYYPPGIIGPFCLQTCVDKDLNFYIYDVAPRIGGGTNVHIWLGHSYGNALWRRRMSTGRRVALEIRRAIDEDALHKIVT